MKAEELKALYDSISALPTAAEQMAAFQKAFESLNSEYEKVVTESTEEVTRLSNELTFHTSQKGKGNLSVVVAEQRFVTPAGRKYQFDGKTVSAEELVLNADLCAKLVAAGSSILKLAE